MSGTVECCGFTPPGGVWTPCGRALGHSGPCAHEPAPRELSAADHAMIDAAYRKYPTPTPVAPAGGAETAAQEQEIAARWPDAPDATDSLVLMLLRAERRMDRAAERQDWAAADTWEERRNEIANTIRADVAYLLARVAQLTTERAALADGARAAGEASERCAAEVERLRAVASMSRNAAANALLVFGDEPGTSEERERALELLADAATTFSAGEWEEIQKHIAASRTTADSPYPATARQGWRGERRTVRPAHVRPRVATRAGRRRADGGNPRRLPRG